MNSTKISILGCGRLGLPLAHFLVTQGRCVKGSTTSDQKVSLLEKANVKPYCFSIDPLPANQDFSDFFDSDVLIVTLPFSRSLSDSQTYLEQINIIVSQIQKSPIQKIIFTSSTSIYPDTIDGAIESMALPLQTDRQKVLFAVEQALMRACECVTILRLGGIWHGRHSAELMLGVRDKVIVNSEARMNVVHVDDCITLIAQLVQGESGAGVFNVCADKHPYRREFYLNMAKQLGYNAPRFDGQQKTSKIVDNTKSKNVLNYSYQYPDPLSF